MQLAVRRLRFPEFRRTRSEGQKVSFNPLVVPRGFASARLAGNIFRDRPWLVPPQQRRKGWRVLPPESTYCTNLEGGLSIRRLSHDWLRPPSSRLGAPSTLKNDGGLSLASPSISHLLSFLPMVQYSITTTTSIRSPLEQDYEYDKDNDVFLFYPSRPAFESSRDHLFLPVRVSPGGPQDESNHSISIARLSTTFRCLKTIG